MGDKSQQIQSWSNGQSVCPVIRSVDKPLILSQLENSCNCCLTYGQKLSAIELIVFVFNVVKEKLKSDSSAICVKQLYLLVKQYMFRHLSRISRCLECLQTKTTCDEISDSDDKQKLSFNNLLTDFIEPKILSINVNKQTIGFHSNVIHLSQCISEVDQMLDNCLIYIFQNYLRVQLRRFGVKRVDYIEMRIFRDHSYLFHYLFAEQNNYHLLDFFQSFPEHFNCFQKNTIYYIRHNSQPLREALAQIHGSPSLQKSFKFGGKTGETFSSLKGFAYLLDPNNRYIGLKDQTLNSNRDFQFKIDSNMTQIYGQEVVGNEVMKWIHTNDEVVFDAQLVIDNDYNNDNRIGSYSWFVTSISRVQHLGQCYVCEGHLFSHFQWNKPCN